MSARKSETKSRLALLVALVALLAAAATQLVLHKNGRSVETARAAQPSIAPPASPAVPAAASAQAATGAPAPRAAAGPQSAGMRAYIDPETGQLREPEQEELAPPSALRTARVAEAPATETSEAPDLALEVPGGGVARLVDDSVTVYAVATIGPDGKLRFEHAQGGAAAQAKVKAGSKSRSRAAAEVNNER